MAYCSPFAEKGESIIQIHQDEQDEIEDASNKIAVGILSPLPTILEEPELEDKEVCPARSN